MIIETDRIYTADEFWKCVLILQELIRTETNIEDRFIERAILRDWLTLFTPLGRA